MHDQSVDATVTAQRRRLVARWKPEDTRPATLGHPGPVAALVEHPGASGISEHEDAVDAAAAPMLSREEQDRLVVAHRGLAERCAARFVRVQRMQELRDDAISEAYIGLIDAARRFDPSRGVMFSTYAGWWIRRHVNEAIEAHRFLVRQAKNHRIDTATGRASREIFRMRGELGRDATAEELAERLDIAVSTARGAIARFTPRDGSISSSGDEVMGEWNPSCDAPSPEDVFADVEEYEVRAVAAKRALEAIEGKRDRDIVRRRLSGEKLTDIGADYGLSRERIRQIFRAQMPRVEKALRKHARSVR